MNSATLTAAQVQALLTYLKSATNKTTVPLNPANADQKAVIDAMLAAGGKTEADYPHLFGSLNSAAQAKTAPADTNVDSVHLVDSGATASGKATASVWACSSTQTTFSGGALFVFDTASGELLAQGSNSAVKNGMLSCSTEAASAKPAGANLTVLFVGHVVDADGNSRYTAYCNKDLATGVGASAGKKNSSAKMATTANDSMGVQCHVNDPVIKHSGNTAVEIAVGRTAGYPPPSNTDYIYVEPSANEDNPYLIVPFTGYVDLSGIIDRPSLTASDMTTNVIVNNTGGSSTYVPRHTSDTAFVNGITASGNRLTFNYPFDGRGYASTASLVYDSCSMALEVISYYYFAFNSIPLNGGMSAPPFYVCSTGSPEEKSVNCTEIAPLYFWWHCAAKGTLVTLEDGSQKPIEEINETCRVKTANGKSLAVVATVLGRHSSDPAKGKNEIYKLVTKNGKTLVATENHMVFMSDSKCRMISHLVVGDTVMTDEGASVIIECSPIKADDMFYGLALGNPEERNANDFPQAMASYYTGGILSGDQETMKQRSREAYHDLDYILPRIPSHLHRDYTSALKHKRY